MPTLRHALPILLVALAVPMWAAVSIDVDVDRLRTLPGAAAVAARLAAALPAPGREQSRTTLRRAGAEAPYSAVVRTWSHSACAAAISARRRLLPVPVALRSPTVTVAVKCGSWSLPPLRANA